MKSNIQLDSKLPNVGTTIFTVMSKMARDYNAINLSQGFPNFPIDQKLIDLVSKHMNAGLNQYSPMEGVIELRESISAKHENLYGIKFDPVSEVNVTAGATQAIYTIISATVKEGDEVIIIEPAYDCYEPAIEINGGITKRLKMSSDDFSIDWTELERLISDKTRMLIINTPHNPTGTILKKADLERIEQVLAKHENIILLSDEVYEHIIFDGEEHQSVCRYPELAKKSFIVYSFGKTFHATGWKMGYVLAPEGLMKEFRKVHQFNVFSCNTPMQYALADYIKDEENYLNLSRMYQDKRDLFLNAISSTKFEIIPTSGTYFSTVKYHAYSDLPDTVFAEELTKKYGVAAIPVSVFYGDKRDDKVLRFCFAKTPDMIESAVEKLLKL